MLNVRRGDIRNQQYAYKAKQYAWSRISKLFPRNISPTDIDACFELNNHFLYVECKTIGKQLDDGQRLFFDRRLFDDKSRGVLFICEHDPLREVDCLSDFRFMQIWCYDQAVSGIAKTNSFTCDEQLISYWFSEFALLADGKPNSFRRGLRETLGVYPPSVLKDFKAVGGHVCTPPFLIGRENKREVVCV